MGAHWAWLGFADVDALVTEARSGAAGQVRLMARYIEKAGLFTAIENHDWEAFARGYNGPDYKRYSYHLKLAAAYQSPCRRDPGRAGRSWTSRRVSSGLHAAGFGGRRGAGPAADALRRSAIRSMVGTACSDQATAAVAVQCLPDGSRAGGGRHRRAEARLRRLPAGHAVRDSRARVSGRGSWAGWQELLGGPVRRHAAVSSRFVDLAAAVLLTG